MTTAFRSLLSQYVGMIPDYKILSSTCQAIESVTELKYSVAKIFIYKKYCNFFLHSILIEIFKVFKLNFDYGSFEKIWKNQ